MTDQNYYQLIIMLALFILSAFFSGSETALLSLDKLRLKYLVEKKRKGAAELQKMLQRTDRLLAGILVGNNLVNIALSVLATTFFVDLYGARGDVITIAVLTPLLLVFSEVCPKTLAASRAETTAFAVLRPIKLVLWLLAPLIYIITAISGLITRLFGDAGAADTMSAEEIKSVISSGARTGALAAVQQRMLHGVFELSQLRVRDVMVPRTEIVGVAVDMPFAQLLDKVKRSRHSRFPVYKGSLDEIVGIIHSKDVLRYVDDAAAFDIYAVMRTPYFVPEAKQVEELLLAFRRRHVHLAVVLDEYGGVEGIVTLEDVLEEIVGEIQDEYDDDEQGIITLGPRRFLVDGGIPLRLLNRRFDLDFADEDATTLAGLLLLKLGHIPDVGEECRVGAVVLVARKVEQHRVERIEMRLE